MSRYLRARGGPESEDIAAQSWLDVARNIGSFTGGEEQFRGWVFTIVRRRRLDHLRNARRRATEPFPDADLLERIAASTDTETEALDAVVGDTEARRIVGSLPSAQAEIVLLRVVAGLSVDEVARLTGRRPGSVRVLQHRALKRLARQIPARDVTKTDGPEIQPHDAREPPPRAG